MKYRKLIKEWRESRGEAKWYLMNFLRNLSRSARLMHSCIRSFNEDSSLIQEAKRNYVVSIASSVETFYRDLFIYTMERDTALLQEIFPKIKERRAPTKQSDPLQQDISLAEIVTTNLSFQSIEDIDGSVSKLFPHSGYLDTLSTYEHICIIPSKGSQICKITLPDQWRRDFSKLFRDRHAFVHNANLECEIPSRDMANLEVLVLQIAQFTSAITASRYNDGMIVANGFPAFLIIEDLISDDWEVVEDTAEEEQTDYN